VKQSRPGNLLNKILPTLNDYSVLAGFLLTFGFLFIRPVFLNSEHSMKFFAYLPATDLIGLDLNQMLDYCESFFVQHGSPYIGNNLYPPLTIVLFGPFLLLEKSTAYAIMTMISAAAYLLMALVIPLLVYKNDTRHAVVQLLFVTGLFSYGLHFELERGQFNLIAFSLALLAVYFFHFQPRFRLLSYALLTISVQLKVFPLIFLIMLVDDWKDWKTNVVRFSKIVIVNVSLLFVLGYQVFKDFLQAISEQALNPHITMTNHSVKVFVELITRKAGFQSLFLDKGVELSQVRAWAEYAGTAQILLQLFAIGCLLVIFLRGIKMNLGGFDPYLLTACTILMLILPSVSNDYKLPLIIGPLAIIFQGYSGNGKKKNLSLAFILLTFLGSLAYSSTLFSYTNKPLILDNNAPSLLILLLAVTFMSMINKPEPALSDILS
jgi:hypothetical protein